MQKGLFDDIFKISSKVIARENGIHKLVVLYALRRKQVRSFSLHFWPVRGYESF